MSKIKVGVLFGGQSGEYEVSLHSACSVLNAIDTEKYIVYKIGITKNGEWYLFEGKNDWISDDLWLENGKNMPICVDFSKKCFVCDGKDFSPDVIFPVLHGDFGEDGRVQSLLEMLGLCFIGCDSKSSTICMDKSLCKTIAIREFVPVVPFVTVDKKDFEEGDYECSFEGNVFVKPTNKGSSIGISKAKGKEQILTSLALALKHSDVALVEKEIEGAECEVAIAEIDGEIVASDVGQITYKGDFYDYETKYNSNSVKYKIPAKIDRECRNLCKKYAITMFKALSCRGICRVDFFVTKNGEIYFNEVNTLPGFTKGSMYPMLFEKLGYNMPKLVDALISEALRKF